MSAIIRRKKHINEAGEQPVAAAQPAQTQAPAAPAQPAAVLAPAQPAATPAAPAAQPQAQPQTVQPAQAPAQAAPAVPAQPAEKTDLQNKVGAFIKELSDNIQKHDWWWAITFNLPETLQREVPEFKPNDPATKQTIAAWNEFKAAPSKEAMDKFMAELNAFANPASPQEATAQQAQQEAVNVVFHERLMENINKYKQINRYSKLMENGYKK